MALSSLPGLRELHHCLSNLLSHSLPLSFAIFLYILSCLFSSLNVRENDRLAYLVSYCRILASRLKQSGIETIVTVHNFRVVSLGYMSCIKYNVDFVGDLRYYMYFLSYQGYIEGHYYTHYFLNCNSLCFLHRERYSFIFT